MRLFFTYLAIASAIVAALNVGVEAMAGPNWGTAAAIAGVYLLTIFDLKFADPRWSMLRRILPNVAWFDCAIYSLPFLYMAYRLQAPGAANEGEAEQPIVWIAGLFGYFIFGVYFVARWRHLRSGSSDKLDWLWSSNMSLGKRFRRYLGIEAVDTSAGNH